MDCSLITDFQQSTAISIAKKFRNLHIGLKGEDMKYTVSKKISSLEPYIMIKIQASQFKNILDSSLSTCEGQ